MYAHLSSSSPRYRSRMLSCIQLHIVHLGRTLQICMNLACSRASKTAARDGRFIFALGENLVSVIVAVRISPNRLNASLRTLFSGERSMGRLIGPALRATAAVLFTLRNFFASRTSPRFSSLRGRRYSRLCSRSTSNTLTSKQVEISLVLFSTRV